MANVLITGAHGFIGKSLVGHLKTLSEWDIRTAVRVPSAAISEVVVGNISANTNWGAALKNIDVVVHLAGLAHQNYSKTELFEVNTEGTLNLARQAIENGVKRLIFISSIKVNGELTSQPFTESDPPNPQQNYAISKLEAEQGLLALAKKSTLEIVIIRPPLVYGFGVSGNFALLLKLANSPIPLPFGAIKNRRSMIGIYNLVDFIAATMSHPNAANQVFLIKDTTVSTTELLQKMREACGRKPRLIPYPVIMLKLLAKLVGKGEMAQKLLSSLEIDAQKAHKMLGWQAKFTIDEQLRKITDDYKKNI